MIKTYALVSAHNMRALPLPLMTLRDAESARSTLARHGHAVYVVNVNAE